MIRSSAPWLALVLLTLSVCWVTLRVARPHTDPYPYAVVAAVYQDSGPPDSPTFTFQGVFSDPQTGKLIDGPPSFRIGIGDGPAETDRILSLSEVSPTYEDGRFTAEVELLDALSMIDLDDPHIVILSAGSDDTPLIPRLPIRYTPYAWTAEYARDAGFARNAADADRAHSADTAFFATEAGTAETADNLTSSSVLIPITGDNWTNTDVPIRATRRGDLVYLSGQARRGFPASSTFAELPAGFRPATGKLLTTSYASNTQPYGVQVIVFPDGRIKLQNSVNLGTLSLDGLVFEVAP